MLSDRDYMQPGLHRLRGTFRPRGSVLTLLLWANGIVFLLTGFGQNPRPMSLLWLRPDLIRQFQVWRMVTYMFAHASFPHVLFNMWGLYVFGRPMEQRLGPTRFMYLYLTSGLVGGGVWLLANWHPQAYPVIGASGAVFGVMMAAAMAFPNQQILLLFPPIPMRLKTFVAGYAAIEILLALNQAQSHGGGIAHIAHLGGILGAFLYMRSLHARPYNAGRWSLTAAMARWWRETRARNARRHFRRTNGTDTEDDKLSAETDRILDKIGESGLDSLTPEERDTLSRARERLRER